MQLLNYAYITDGLIAIKKPLARFVTQSIQNSRMYKNHKDPDAWWNDGVIEKLNSEGRKEYSKVMDNDVRLESMDISLSVTLLEIYFNTIFLELLGPDACMVRAWAQEIRSIRNSVSHQKKDDLSYGETKHGLEAMKMLMEKINEISKNESDETQRIQKLLDDLEARESEKVENDASENSRFKWLKRRPPIFDFSTNKSIYKSMIKIGYLMGYFTLMFDHFVLIMQMDTDKEFFIARAFLAAFYVIVGVPLNALFGVLELPEWEGALPSMVGTLTKIFSNEAGFQWRYGWTGLYIFGGSIGIALMFGWVIIQYKKMVR